MSNMSYAFVLNAIDDDQLYPFLCVRFDTSDLDTLRTILDLDETEDALIDRFYTLSSDEFTRVCDTFDIAFETTAKIITLWKYDPSRLQIPYFIHTGYELPLLLQGRKKLAFMNFDTRFEQSMDLKARFDHYVSAGCLHVVEDKYTTSNASGESVTIYDNQYTPLGEEWRIPARKLINRTARFSKGWTEFHERLEGMLMGYEDWQNDWWLNHLAESGHGLYGASFRCALTKMGYEWVRHSGDRALPPMEGDTFTLYSSYWFDDEAAKRSLAENPEIEVFVQFNIAGKHLMDAVDLRSSGPYQVPTSMIPEINANLGRNLRIVLARE